ncbi:polyprotein [Paraphaeosphaeria sporulosa]
MHSTLEEIAAWVRSVELPPSPRQDQVRESFYEDETITATREEDVEEVPGYRQGRKVGYDYPTPPVTPPPVTLLAQSMARDDSDLCPVVQTGQLQTIPWAAAFMAGTEAGSAGKYIGKVLDKAQLRRMITAGKKPHRSVLPEPPKSRNKLEDHPLYDMWKEAERSHLQSHKEMRSWSEVATAPVKAAGHQILDCMWVYTYKSLSGFEVCGPPPYVFFTEAWRRALARATPVIQGLRLAQWTPYASVGCAREAMWRGWVTLLRYRRSIGHGRLPREPRWEKEDQGCS